MVNELRTATGAGLLDCKKALTESNGDVAAAVTILRKKLGSKLDKLSTRATKEGLVESYIHVGGKVGVLVEVNCETDFVARNDSFKAFVKDLCLQIAAANPLYVPRSGAGGRSGQRARDRGGVGPRQAACGRTKDRGWEVGELLFDGVSPRSALREAK